MGIIALVFTGVSALTLSTCYSHKKSAVEQEIKQQALN